MVRQAVMPDCTPAGVELQGTPSEVISVGAATKTAVDNIASQRVEQKSGATREGVLSQRLLLHGQRHDTVLFAIIRAANVNDPTAKVP
jgi:exopolyphosphatase/pppGpp-phosphohydrolase